MKRVYVTESGYFDEYCHFWGTGVIGVDCELRAAVKYPIQKGCYRLKVVLDVLGFIVIYKSPFSNLGYRVTRCDLY